MALVKPIRERQLFLQPFCWQLLRKTGTQVLCLPLFRNKQLKVSSNDIDTRIRGRGWVAQAFSLCAFPNTRGSSSVPLATPHPARTPLVCAPAWLAGLTLLVPSAREGRFRPRRTKKGSVTAPPVFSISYALNFAQLLSCQEITHSQGGGGCQFLTPAISDASAPCSMPVFLSAPAATKHSTLLSFPFSAAVIDHQSPVTSTSHHSPP